MNYGSCLCGSVKFEIPTEPEAVFNCHCRMCQKQHGAAFATYARFLRDDVRYLSGEDCLAIYNSSDDVLRKFCKNCGSNIEWEWSKRYPQWVAIAVASFDTEFRASEVKEMYVRKVKRTNY